MTPYDNPGTMRSIYEQSKAIVDLCEGGQMTRNTTKIGRASIAYCAMCGEALPQHTAACPTQLRKTEQSEQTESDHPTKRLDRAERVLGTLIGWLAQSSISAISIKEAEFLLRDLSADVTNATTPDEKTKL